jgi:hypothetical protein
MIRIVEEHHSDVVFARNVVHILMEMQGQTTIWLLKQEMANRYRQQLKIDDCQTRLKHYVEVRT